ncbi:MAG: P-loop NTPase fold protein [bacterium]|nr:P-loop NTPase fold protein [bacterium]
MVKYDFSAFNQNTLIEFTGFLLKEELNLNLETIQPSLGPTPSFWQIDRDGTDHNLVEVVVDVIPFSQRVETLVESLVARIEDFYPKYKSNSLIIVVFDELTKSDLDYLNSALDRITSGHYKLILQDWINEKIVHHPSILKRYSPSLIDSKIPKNDIPDDFLKNAFSGVNRGFYTAGHIWGKEDQFDKFIQYSQWENGHEKNETKIVNSVEPGDVIFLKSTFQNQGTSYLRIKAVGIVSRNLKDGHLLNVLWFELPTSVDIPGFGHFRRTFQKIQPKFINEIVFEVVGENTNLYDAIKQLEIKIQKQTQEVQESLYGSDDSDLYWFAFDISFTKNSAVNDIYEFNINIPQKLNENWGLIYSVEFKQVFGLGQIREQPSDDPYGIPLVVRYLFRKPIPFKDISSDFADLPGVEQFGAFKISIELFQDIINLTEFDRQMLDDKEIAGILSKSGFHNDHAYQNNDLLNIENDVRAFALLLASKDINPPVAIALFGKWGSGKSFFMRHLQRHIHELSGQQSTVDKKLALDSNSNEKEFCVGVAHIWFNAWSYLDANLWAGLAHSLFEKLNEFIRNETKGEIERLKVQVRISKRLHILHSDLKKFTEKKSHLQELKSKLVAERNKKISSFLFSRYQTEILDFLKENGISESESRSNSAQSLTDKVKFGLNVFSYIKRNPISVLTIYLPITFVIFLGKELIEFYYDSLAPFLSSIWANLYAAMVPALIPISRFFSKKKNALKKLKQFANDIIANSSTNDQELNDLKKAIDEIDPIIEEIEISINREYSLKSDITQLAIADFISSKSNQKEYIDRLGIISVIRKDFETLSDLFYPPNEIVEDNKDLDIAQEQLIDDREYLSEQFKEGKTLERIILYIDDLDRCPDPKVLEVIQAVHLLMAFPLFNVIVGVDKRCLTNALHYQFLIRYSKFQNEVGELKNIEEVLPEEYIEKIFQIPFHLQIASEKEIKDLTKGLLQNQILEEEEEESETTDVNMASDEIVTGKSSKSNSEKKQISESEDQIITAFTPSVKSTNEDSQIPSLKLDEKEVILLSEFAPIAGDTPRLVKRFINIYRIIRAHEHLTYDQNEKEQDFLIIMFLIAINMGKKDVFQKLNSLIYVDPGTIGSKLKGVPELVEILGRIEASKNLRPLLDQDSDRVTKYINFVKRFSFH